jgi:hypothetical protein
MAIREKIRIELEGKRDFLSATAFFGVGRELLAILKNVDSALSHESAGVMVWFIESLKKESPATIVMQGELKPERHETDLVRAVHEISIDGLTSLERHAQRPKFFADSTIFHARQLAEIHAASLERCTVIYQDRRVNITAHTLANVDTLLGEAYESESTIIGDLDSVTVHKGNEFRVWEEVSGNPVRCRFREDQFEQVREALGKRVRVEGTVKSNTQGNPIAITVHRIEIYPREEDLPSIQDISGLVPDLTGRLSLKEYMKALRDG